jgi:hypothetical protein
MAMESTAPLADSPQPAASGWRQSRPLAATLFALALLPALVQWNRVGFHPEALVRSDALSYIAGGMALEAGLNVHDDYSIPTEGKIITARPFLYHPAAAAWCAAANRWLPSPRAVYWAAQFLGVALLSAGVWAAAKAYGLGLGGRTLALLALWMTGGARQGLIQGNVSLAVAGLALLGAADLARGREARAGLAWGLASLLKPAYALGWVLLALFWRDGRPRRKWAFLGAWALTHVLFALTALIKPDTLSDFAAQLFDRSAKSWAVVYEDGSVHSLVLTLCSPGEKPWPSRIQLGHHTADSVRGTLEHPALPWANGISRGAFAALLVAVFWRRRALKNRPDALLGLSLALGFAVQPLSWTHNYGALLLLPLALGSGGMMFRERAPAALESEPPSRRRVWLAWGLVFLALATPGRLLAPGGLLAKALQAFGGHPLDFHGTIWALAILDNLAVLGLIALALWPGSWRASDALAPSTAPPEDPNKKTGAPAKDAPA